MWLEHKLTLSCRFLQSHALALFKAQTCLIIFLLFSQDLMAKVRAMLAASKNIQTSASWDLLNWPSRNCVKKNNIKKNCLISNVQLSLAHLVHNSPNITRTQGAKTYLSVQKCLLEISLNFFSQNIFGKFLVFVNWFFWLILQ